MSTTYDSSFVSLPVEIVYHIIDYLDTSTTFLSLCNVCTHFRAIFSTYNRYQLDFNSISKCNFHRICQLIQPDNIFSLKLSDDNKTPGQIKLFLSLFKIDQFSQLRSLSLFAIDDNDLTQMLYSNISLTLTSLSINWREAHCPTPKSMSLLLSTLDRLTLRTLELKTGSYAIEEMSWLIQCTLQHLTLMYITQKHYRTILRTTPNLKTLVLNHCSMHKVDEDDETVYEQLTSLTLIDSRMSMRELISILSLTPSLIYLKIICLPDSFEMIADGFRWEQFIRVNLPLLHKFEFFFTNIYNVYYGRRNIELLISRFQTPFWLEEKQWFVTCDYMNYLNQIMLYTIPLCHTDFMYECEANKISCSNSIMTNLEPIITDKVQTINLTLTRLMAGFKTTRNIVPNGYLFRNVTKLTIDVDQEWSLECIQFLSRILDLSRLEKLVMNPDLNLKCFRNTVDNINILMKFVYNLKTLAIHPYSSYHNIKIIKNLCAIIPHHIKYLEVTIKDLDTMKMILDHHQHLWSLTLLASSDQSLPWSEFIEELNNRNKDFTYWESYYSLRIWFDQTKVCNIINS